ncbi:MAG: Wzz/FepE/Etk N-terminal domain-containing protein [Actinomycetota bacterium]|nr:Wzz/FepE/Etk N-terminal domain-containing protein [Actinomycetota bacterium]
MAATEEEQARQLSDYIGIIRRRFWLIVLLAAVTVAGAATYVLNKTPVYRSSMKILVGQGEGVFRSDLVNATEELTQTASDLLETDVVATTVIEELDLGITSNQLLGNLGVSTEPATAVLVVSYDDTDRERGGAILAEVGETFEELVSEELSGEGQNGNITATVFDDAHPLPGQVDPKPVRDIAVAGALGLLIGVLAAFAREQFDRTIRSVPQTELAFGQSVSATLPPKLLGFQPLLGRGKKHQKKRLDPVLAELAMQRLRANILWSWEPGQKRTVVVTSAHPEEGKTTVAANLAVLMAIEGRDVIIVEADLRRPLLHSYLGIQVGPQTRGLDAIGRGEATIDEALTNVALDNAKFGVEFKSRRAAEQRRGPRLRAVLAAPGHTWPAEFTMDRIIEIVEELRDKADYVIFDAPPILVVSDSYPLVVAADSVIAVVRKGKSTAPSTTSLGRTLARLRVRNVRAAELVVTEVETDVDTGRYSYYSASETETRRERASAAEGTPAPQPASGETWASGTAEG